MTGLVVNFVSKVVRHRGLIRSMVERDLKSRYVGSVMGIFWSVIHPLVLLVCYTFVFSVIFQLQLQHPLAPKLGVGSFAVYLFCGILPWMMFQETLTRSSNVLVDNANLITKTLFPSEILPVAVLMANLVNHLIGVAIFLVIILFLPAVPEPLCAVDSHLPASPDAVCPGIELGGFKPPGVSEGHRAGGHGGPSPSGSGLLRFSIPKNTWPVSATSWSWPCTSIRWPKS